MQRKDRGVIYRFSYEASKPRRLAGRRLATGKTLVSKFDESSSLLEKQQIRKTVVQTPQAPQKPQQNTQGQQNTQDRRPLGFQGQDYRSGSQGQGQGQQHPQHTQQAPQGHHQGQEQNSQGQHSQGQQSQPIIPLRPISPRIRQRPATMSPQGNQYDEMYRYEYSEVDEVLEKEKSPTQWERIRPYVGLGGAVIAVIIPLAILIKYGLNWKDDRAKSLNNYT